MRKLQDLAVLLLLFSTLVSPAAAADEKAKTKIDPRVEEGGVQLEISSLRHQLAIVQRDQLNYQIEKDLLKEAYSSNLQSVNLVITIVFGIFAVLGYAGMRSIKEIRSDYRAELERLRELKGSFESELDSLRAKQRDFELRVTELAKINDAQDRRLKVMEIVEKAGSLINSRNYSWALEHISVGLALDPTNAILLEQQALCSGRLGRLSDAIQASRRFLELEPGNLSQIANLCEYLALAGNESEFNEMYAKHALELDRRADGGLSTYLKAVSLAIVGSIDRARELLVAYAKNQPPEPKGRIESWSFDDALSIVDPFPPGERKEFLLAIVRYFKGEQATADFLEAIR